LVELLWLLEHPPQGRARAATEPTGVTEPQLPTAAPVGAATEAHVDKGQTGKKWNTWKKLSWWKKEKNREKATYVMTV